MDEQASIAIALDADPRIAEAALLHGRRMARDLGASWTAVFVQRPSPRSDERLAALAAVVRSHGGELHTATGRDVATALVRIVREVRADLLVIGPSRRPRFLRRLVRGTTEKILAAHRNFAIVVPGQGAMR